MGMGVGVGVGSGVGVAVGAGVGVGVAVGAGVGMGVAVGAGVGMGVAVGAGVGVGVAVGAGVGVGVAIGAGVKVSVAVGAGVGVGVAIGAGVGVGVAIGAGVKVGMAVGGAPVSLAVEVGISSSAPHAASRNIANKLTKPINETRRASFRGADNEKCSIISPGYFPSIWVPFSFGVCDNAGRRPDSNSLEIWNPLRKRQSAIRTSEISANSKRIVD